MVHEAIRNEVKESCTSISLIEYIQYLCDDICIFNVFYTSHICTIHICTSIDKAFVCFPYTFLLLLSRVKPCLHSYPPLNAITTQKNQIGIHLQHTRVQCAGQPNPHSRAYIDIPGSNARDNQTVIVGHI